MTFLQGQSAHSIPLTRQDRWPGEITQFRPIGCWNPIKKPLSFLAKWKSIIQHILLLPIKLACLWLDSTCFLVKSSFASIKSPFLLVKSQVVLLSTPGPVPEIHVQLLFRRYFSHRFPIFRLGSPVVSILPWKKVSPPGAKACRGSPAQDGGGDPHLTATNDG